MRWLVMPFLRYADFKGRSGRTEFWTFFGLSVAAFFLTVVATGLSTDVSTVTQPKAPGANASPAGVIGYMLWWLASIVPWFAAQVRRFHDQGRSGWLCLIGVGGYVAVGFGVMPVAGILFLAAMALMALPGEETENHFGPPVNAGNDWETAPIELDPPPADARVCDVGLAAPSFGDTLTSLEPHSEASVPQREMPDAKPFLTPQPISLGGQDPASTTPVSSGTINTEYRPMTPEVSSLPDDVSLAEDGQYSCRGYIFNSLGAAVSYSRRQSTPAPSLRNANSAELDDNRPRRGALDQAHARQDAAPHQFRPSSTQAAPPSSSGLGNHELGEDAGSANAMPPYLPADVKPEGNGRFSCGG